jgi:hypothetical protein
VNEALAYNIDASVAIRKDANLRAAVLGWREIAISLIDPGLPPVTGSKRVMT